MSSVIKSNSIVTSQTKVELHDIFNLSCLTEVKSYNEDINGIPCNIDNGTEDAYKIIEDAKEESSKILEEAYIKAQEIIEDANREANAIKELANDQAENLLKENEANLVEQQDRVNDECNKLLLDAHNEREALLNSLYGDIKDTIYKLVGHIISNEVAKSNNWVNYLVKKLLSIHHIEDEATLKVNNTVYNGLSETDIAKIKENNIVKIEIDNELSDTACILEADNTGIQYDIKDGLDRVLKDISLITKLEK